MTIKRFANKVIKNETVLSSSSVTDTDNTLDNSLRPRDLNEYVGQTEIKRNLGYLIESAKLRKEPLDHILLHGPPGLGKTTLANIIGNEVGANVRITSGPALEKQGDIASIITNLKENDILFIDEIHRLKPAIEEILYSAMEDFAIDLVIGKGPAAKSMRLKLPRFTLVGATTKMSMLSSPLRDRFGAVYRLQFYSPEEIMLIIEKSALKLGVVIDKNASYLLARSSRQTPRIANRILKRIRDFALVHSRKTVDEALSRDCLALLGIDELGLDEMDRQILTVIIDKFRGGPVGLGSLAAATSDEESTIEDVYEPFLLQLGMLERTSRGRTATERAYKHLGFEFSNNLKD